GTFSRPGSLTGKVASAVSSAVAGGIVKVRATVIVSGPATLPDTPSLPPTVSVAMSTRTAGPGLDASSVTDSPEVTAPGMFTAATRPPPELRKPHTLTLRGTLLGALPCAGAVPPEHPARTVRAAAARTASA